MRTVICIRYTLLRMRTTVRILTHENVNVLRSRTVIRITNTPARVFPYLSLHF